MKASGSNAGFSLVEVMVAIVILGVAVVGLTRGLTTALGASKDAERQTAAALFASGKIELIRTMGLPADGETTGDCGSELPAYRWRQSVETTTVDRLHAVTVTVEDSVTGGEIFELKTMLFDTGGGTSDLSANGKDQDKTKKQNRGKNGKQ